ncbi:hypothetical protein CJP46_28995 [Paenibacillus sp. XY044]|nr:hypothetical protein CJP46_28995 [Paenibacillus sp. XY044]
MEKWQIKNCRCRTRSMNLPSLKVIPAQAEQMILPNSMEFIKYDIPLLVKNKDYNQSAYTIFGFLE